MGTATATKTEAWHFLPDDRRRRFGSRELVTVGSVRTVDGELEICSRGLHASLRAIDALQYAPGSVICRVELSGTILRDSDKLCASRRRVLAMADAAHVLHEFACWCAEGALRPAKVDDLRCWAAIEAKRKWLRGEAAEEELLAARRAARWAADSAAYAARSAAYAADAAAYSAAYAAHSAADAAAGAAHSAADAAAGAAAHSAAYAAARSAAGAAARRAARWAQNVQLEAVLYALL